MEAIGTAILAFLAVLTIAAFAFLFAVWFGLMVVAPRIRRALDRAEKSDEEPSERAD